MKDDIDGRSDIPEEDITEFVLWKQLFGNCLFDTFELPREDAVKLAGIIDRIIKGEYI